MFKFIKQLKNYSSECNQESEPIQILEKRIQFLESVIENLPVAIVLKDPKDNFKIKMWNKAAEELFGVSKQEILNKTVHDFLPKEQADFNLKVDQNAIKEGQLIDTLEEPGLSKTKGAIYLHTKKLPLKILNETEAQYLLCTSDDITKSLENHKKLLNEKDAVLRRAKFAIITINIEGIITFFNEEAERILGYKAAEMIGKCTPAFFHDHDEIVAVSQALTKEFGKEVAVGLETFKFKANLGLTDERQWSYVRKDGQRVQVKLNVTALRNKNNEIYGYMGIARDLTEELEILKDLEQERTKNLHSSKLASLGEMSAGVAHEINNPLSIIAGNVFLLNKCKNDPEKFSSKIEAIQRSVERISKIVLGLKRFSHLNEESKHSLFVLSNIIQEALILTESKSKQNSTVVEVNIKSEGKILCDDVEIEQVIINLVNNAVDAVKILPERWIKINVFEDNSELVMQVKDSGSGISDEVAKNLFEPFYTTKPVGEGTGLGLSIIKTILDKHKSKISVNKDDAHTCFEIRFPLVVEPELL